jgi:copper transport protein
VNRFSRLALASVTVLVVTGVYQSWRGLGSWDALTSTSYGRLLLAKLVAVLVLLAGAGASRRWTGRLMLAADEARTAAAVPVEERVPQTVGASSAPTDVRVGRADGPSDGGPSDGGPSDDGASDDGAPDPDHEFSDEASDKSSGKISGKASDEADRYRRALRRSVLVEVVVGIVVLVITTLLTGTQPGRAATEAAAASATAAAGETTASTTTIPFDVGTEGGHGKVQIQMTPSRVGENSVQAVIYGSDGGFATVPELRLTFTLESQQIGPIDAGLTDKGGYWTADGVTLPVAGTWTMKATVRTTDIDQVTVSKTVKIG